MSDGFSQYQTSRLGVSAAKARAISERSQGTFDLGVTALEERESLLRAEDQLQQIAKEAEKNARKRGRKAGLGRLIGSGIGYAIGGPAGKAALGTALGSLAGTAAAGGFKSYGVDVPDSLVPGGIFYGRERDAFKQRAEDLEKAFDDLTDAQRQGIGKSVITDYLTGRGLGKLGEAKIKGLDTSLDDLLEAGEITKVDYLKDILRSSAGGIGEDRLSVLTELSDKILPYTQEFTDPQKLIKQYSSGKIAVDKPGELKKLMYGMTGYKIDPETGNILDELQPRLSTDIGEQAKNSLFQPKKVLTQEEVRVNDFSNVLETSPNQFKPGVPFQQSSILNQGTPNEIFNDRTLPYKNLLDLGVINQEQYDNFMSNPYEFAKSFGAGSNIGSRKTNSLFQSTVGPMGAY